MKVAKIVLRVNMHQLTVLDYRFNVTLSGWWPWHYFMQKSAAMWWVHVQHLPDTH